MDLMQIRRALISMIGSEDMGLVLPSWIQAGIVTVEETGNTLVIPHSFGVRPTDAYLIQLKQDYTSTSVADVTCNILVWSMKGRSETSKVMSHGALHNYSLSNGGSAPQSSSTLDDMDSSNVTFGKLNNYSSNYRQGEQYLYIICNRTLPGDT